MPTEAAFSMGTVGDDYNPVNGMIIVDYALPAPAARVVRAGISQGLYQLAPSPVGFPTGFWRSLPGNRTVLHAWASPNATGGRAAILQTIGH